MNRASVYVEDLPKYHALKMIWQKRVHKQDLRSAFDSLGQSLKQSDHALYVIVDLQADPDLPMREAIQASVSGPFRDPKLVEWLVIGSSTIGRMIGQILANATKRDNIRWFDSEAEVMDYLQGSAASKAS
jgi:hypothetical protein